MNSQALKFWEPDRTAARAPEQVWDTPVFWGVEPSVSHGRQIVVCNTKAEAVAMATGTAEWMGSTLGAGTAPPTMAYASNVALDYLTRNIALTDSPLHLCYAGAQSAIHHAGGVFFNASSIWASLLADAYIGRSNTVFVGGHLSVTTVSRSTPVVYVATPPVALTDLNHKLVLDSIHAAIDPGAIETEHYEDATKAARQAADFVVRNNLPGTPRVMMSDDGVLTLQWRNESTGAALIFTGDGTVSIALKNAQHSYLDSVQDDLPLDATLPIELISTLETITG